MLKKYTGEVFEAMGGVAIKPKDPKRQAKIDKLMNDPGFVGQRKLNGERLITFCSNFTGRKAVGRGTSNQLERMDKTGLVPHILNIMHNAASAKEIVLDGEVLFISKEYTPEAIENYAFKEDFWKTREIMGKYKYPERGVEQQREEGWLHYFVFDVLAYDGYSYTDATYEERIKLIEETIKPQFAGSTYVHFVPVVRTTEEKQALFEECIELGLEGIMLKRLKGAYRLGKKPANEWVKLKKADHADCVILGYSDPSEFTEIKRNGKRVLGTDGRPIKTVNRFFTHEWIGAIWMGQWSKEAPRKCHILDAKSFGYDIVSMEIDGVKHWLIPVAKVSGMPDNLREEISDCKTSFLGKIVQIDYFDETEEAYYQPRFMFFREDKKSTECIWGEKHGD